MLGWRTLIAILFFPVGSRSFLMEKMVKGSSVDRRLLAYAIASTTVIGSGSLAQAGIYGKTDLNLSMSSNTFVSIDLEQDGEADLGFIFGPDDDLIHFAVALRPVDTDVLSGATNYSAVVVDGNTSFDFDGNFQDKDAAAKLSGGFTVGETLSAYSWNVNAPDVGFGGKMQIWDPITGNPTEGNFTGVTEKYIGFRVHLSSTEELVYGWAKVSTVTNLNEIGVSGDVILHGYAYESTPNTAIVAGASPVPEPTSLAIFAMGGAGIAAWKRRRKAVAQA
jgi:PEP-CTERM motif